MSRLSPRPGYWDIVLEYLREGYRAWQERDAANGTAVEQKLGLSDLEGIRFQKHLAGRGLIELEEAFNAIAAYYLTPEGLAFVEGLPSIEQVLAAQARLIGQTPGPTEPEKARALTTLRDTTIRLAIEKGVGWVLSNLPRLAAIARAQFPWFPDFGPPEADP